MIDTVKTISIGKGIAKADWILLEQTPDTALIFKPQVHEGGVRGWLVRFKKERNNKWEELEEKNFQKLSLYEGVRIELGTEQIKKLYDEIKKLGGISKKGVEYGETEYVFGKKEEVLVVSDKNIKNTIEQILAKGFTKEFWQELTQADPQQATYLSLLHLQSERLSSLKEFKESIEKNLLEEYWQDYFEKNKWIFGYGLDYKILRQEQSQPNYGGIRINGTGGQRGDFLVSTEGDYRFTVLVEIKTPQTPLLQGTEPQRNGAWSLSKQFSDSITQLQANIPTWEIKGSREEDNRDKFEKKDIFTINPNGILVIGRLNELGTRDKRNTFQRFRQSMHGLEIITFDELLKRADFIVEGMVQERKK